MRTSPRQYILETWRAFARAATSDGKWSWGGRDGSNSVSDAEQILCLLYPATEVPGFRLDRPDDIEDDVLAVLKPLGDRHEIPILLLRALDAYLENYAEDGNPVFTGGSYLRPEQPGDEVTEEQRGHDVTKSYSISVTLCLSAKGFLREFQRTVERPELRADIDATVAKIDRRLTAAMVGLLRSFVINIISPDSEAERILQRTVSQGRVAGRILMQSFTDELQPVRDKLPELTFGLPAENERILRDYPERLFECGWTWGVADDASEIDLPAAVGVSQPYGIAESRPSLHFTVNALDGLLDLFSRRTSRLGLLGPEQQALREALNLRWGLALQYWSTLATFGEGRWPIEDVPWESTDGRSSPYFTELVLGILTLDQRYGGDTSQEVLGRSVAVLEELSQRGRINRRAIEEDRNITLHHPGVLLPLRGSEKQGPPLVWTYTGYAATLAETALRAASVSTSRRTRTRLIEVADSAVEHLLARRFTSGPAGLWDDPGVVFPSLEAGPDRPAWDLTERAIEVFVTAADVVQDPPVADPALVDQARAKIAEARHILDYELLAAPTAGGQQTQRLLSQARSRLNRADNLSAERPATAGALADQVLRDLDELASARLDAGRSL